MVGQELVGALDIWYLTWYLMSMSKIAIILASLAMHSGHAMHHAQHHSTMCTVRVVETRDFRHYTRRTLPWPENRPLYTLEDVAPPMFFSSVYEVCPASRTGVGTISGQG